jgi:hypothetical protein
MIITLIALYFFIAGLTAEWVSNQIKLATPSGGERWCLSLFCGLLWPVHWFVYSINR